MRMMAVTSLWLAVLPGVAHAAGGGSTVYVDESAGAGGDGSSWATAFRDLQDAFAAVDGGTSSIWIAEGTYTPDRGTGDREDSFTLIAPPELSILGGFPSGGGDLSDRDPAEHETVLSGDLAGDDVATFEPMEFGDDGLPSNGSTAGVHFENGGDNSERLLEFAFGGGPIEIDGVTIEGARHPSSSGAVDCNDVPVTFRSVTFRENYSQNAGAVGVIVDDGVRFHQCVFERNDAGGRSVVYVNGVDVEFVGCRFRDNGRSALIIGGDTPNVVFRECDVERNIGPVIWMNRFSNEPFLEVDGCRFIENISPGGPLGGVLYADLIREDTDSMVVRDCVFQRNWSGTGGAIRVGDTNASIQGCLFDSNEAYSHGGALGVENSGQVVRVDDCRFVGNTAGWNGGAVWVFDNNGPGVILTGCDLIGNRADGLTNSYSGGGGLYGGTAIRCRFIGNEAVDQGADLASGFGGGSFLTEAYGCLYIGNRARHGGGWCALTSNTLVAESCVFVGNTARYGGAVRGGWGLVHSTVVGNHAEEVHGGVRYSPILYSIVWGNTDGLSGTVLDQQVGDEPNSIGWGDSIIEGWTGDGNSGAWPGFVDYLGPDGVPVSGDENFRVGVGSPAIDGGSESLDYCGGSGPEAVDIDGRPRCVDGGSGVSRTDIGAFEYGGSVRCGIADPGEPFGTLDLADIVAFISAFDDQGWDGDLAEPYGVWDLADIVRFVTVFSMGCP